MTKIWIDLDNSPHVPLFVPIIEELRDRGYEVFVTARNAYQVCELADVYGLPYHLIGRHYGKHFAAKLLGVGVRAAQLLPAVLQQRPALAVSHGSRSQLAVAVMTGIPSVMIADYEFARIWAMIRPTWVIVPDVISAESMHADPGRVLHYPGIKEDVYLPRFRPDPSIRERLGLRARDLVVTVRPPATEAHYHNPEGDALFRDVVAYLAGVPRVRMIMLPRNAGQRQVIGQTWPELVASGAMVLPRQAENGLNLIWHSDLVISGGGTMNREAAAMGVPVYSIFRGPVGAVDRALETAGRLVMLASAAEARSRIELIARNRDVTPHTGSHAALGAIIAHITRILDGAAAPAPAAGAL
jgi:predicted glycosyltransferase